MNQVAAFLKKLPIATEAQRLKVLVRALLGPDTEDDDAEQQPVAPQVGRSDQSVSNRSVRVWRGATENGP